MEGKIRMLKETVEDKSIKIESERRGRQDIERRLNEAREEIRTQVNI